MTAGRWARLLLVGTLLGLAAMHTLGHGPHATGHSVLSRGVNAEAKALAGQIVATQQAEVDAMRKILGRL